MRFLQCVPRVWEMQRARHQKPKAGERLVSRHGLEPSLSRHQCKWSPERPRF